LWNRRCTLYIWVGRCVLLFPPHLLGRESELDREAAESSCAAPLGLGSGRSRAVGALLLDGQVVPRPAHDVLHGVCRCEMSAGPSGEAAAVDGQHVRGGVASRSPRRHLAFGIVHSYWRRHIDYRDSRTEGLPSVRPARYRRLRSRGGGFGDPFGLAHDRVED
jgi:hypothetical protein